MDKTIIRGDVKMKYVIIGGVAGGMSAAMEIIRTDPDADITVLEQGEIYSYGQCGLPYAISNHISSLDQLIVRDVETFRETYDIDARVRTKVNKIDIHNQTVSGKTTNTNKPFQLQYDRLLIATGSSPIFPDFPGKELSSIHTIKTIPDTKKMINDLNNNVENVVIVGGGYIGLEMAENLVALGKHVTMIQRGSQLAKIFDSDMAEIIHEKAKEKGIQLVLNEAVEGFVGTNRVEAVKTNKDIYEAEFVLLGIGMKPNTEFLLDTGIHLNDQKAIYVDPHQQTNIKNIYAAGDCATNYHRVKQIQDHIPLGTTANKQGRIAGSNMAGNPLTFKGIVGTSILRFFDITLGRTGINEAEARALNIPYRVEQASAKSGAGYFPESKRINLKLLYHKKTYHLLGGQIIGGAGVDKRIDVLATALYNEMTIQELVDLDLAYAPPYNSVWDPLQQMSRKSYSD